MADDWEATKRAAQSPFHCELQYPLTEHEALGLAIIALAHTPNVYLSSDYATISEFLTALGEAYENGAVKEAQERLEEENLRKEAYEDERRRWTKKAFPAQSLPEPEESRKVEREPEM